MAREDRGSSPPPRRPQRRGGLEAEALAQAAKPRVLAAGKLARPGLDEFDGGGQVAFSADVLNDLAIAHGLRGGAAQGTVRCQQLPDLLDPAGGEHLLHPLLDPPVQLLPRPGQNHHLAAAARTWLLELRLFVAQRFARPTVDLEGPDDPPLVVRMQPGRGQRIHQPQPFVQFPDVDVPQLLLNLPAKIPVRGRPRIHAPQQRFEVEGRAAHEEDALAAARISASASCAAATYCERLYSWSGVTRSIR